MDSCQEWKKIQTALARVWTKIAYFVSYDDKYYIMHVSELIKS